MRKNVQCKYKQTIDWSVNFKIKLPLNLSFELSSRRMFLFDAVALSESVMLIFLDKRKTCIRGVADAFNMYLM